MDDNLIYVHNFVAIDSVLAKVDISKNVLQNKIKPKKVSKDSYQLIEISSDNDFGQLSSEFS